jgi:hypothetical protein
LQTNHNIGQHRLSKKGDFRSAQDETKILSKP